MNVVKMTIMWSVSSFSGYVLLYLNKYLPGTIFVNFYLEVLSGLIAYPIGKPLYNGCGLRIAYSVAYSIILFGLFFIFMFETEIIEPYFIDDLGSPPSPYPPRSAKDRDYHLSRIVPIFTLIAKIGTHILFSINWFVSFGNRKVFPNLKRATAIGICNFIARVITAFAPLVAELDKPLPIYLLLCFNTLGLLTSFTFLSEAE